MTELSLSVSLDIWNNAVDGGDMGNVLLVQHACVRWKM